MSEAARRFQEGVGASFVLIKGVLNARDRKERERALAKLGEAGEIAEVAAEIVARLDKKSSKQKVLVLEHLNIAIDDFRTKFGWRKELGALKGLRRELDDTIANLPEDAALPPGISQVFAKHAVGEALANAGALGIIAQKLGVTAMELGVSASLIINLMKSRGLEVAPLSPMHGLAIALAAAIVLPLERIKGDYFIRNFVANKASFAMAAAALLSMALPAVNTVSVVRALGASTEASDAGEKAAAAVNTFRAELDRALIREDAATSEIEAFFDSVEAKMRSIVETEVSGESREGEGGSGVASFGSNAWLKTYILGGEWPEYQEEIDARSSDPELQERGAAARERINERMRTLPEGERFALAEGESVSDAVRRYGASFAEKAEPLFRELEGYGDPAVPGKFEAFLSLVDDIREQSDPVYVKLTETTGTPRLTGADLEREKENLARVMQEIGGLFQTELSEPMRALIGAVSGEMNQLGDPNPITVDIPAFNPDASILDTVHVSETHVDVALFRSVMLDRFATKGTWALAFLVLAFSSIGTALIVGGRLRKKQEAQYQQQSRELSGGEDEETAEMAYAREIAATYERVLSSETGLLSGASKLLPKSSAAWFALSPLEVLTAARLRAAHEFAPLQAEKRASVLGALRGIRATYGGGGSEILRPLTEAPHIEGFNRYLGILQNGARMTIAMEQFALPGLVDVIESGKKIRSARRAGQDISPGLTGDIRRYQAEVAQMALRHIAFRARIARTAIGVLQSTYEEFMQSGTFAKFDTGGLSELGRVSFDITANNELPEDYTDDRLRGSLIRNAARSAFDSRIEKEQAKLKVLDEQLTALETLAHDLKDERTKLGYTDATFNETVRLARAMIRSAQEPFREHKDKVLRDQTPSGLVKGVLMREITAEVTQKLHRSSKKTEGADTYSAREQLAALMTEAKRFSIPLYKGYRQSIQLERKRRGENTVDDYLAIEIRVDHEDGNTASQVDIAEYRLHEVFQVDRSPEQAQEMFRTWLNEIATPRIELSVEKDTTLRSIDEALKGLPETSARFFKEGGTPADIRLQPGSEDTIEGFYDTFVPTRIRFSKLMALRTQAEALNPLGFTKEKKSDRLGTQRAFRESIGRLRSELQTIRSSAYDFPKTKERVLQLIKRVAEAKIKGANIILKPYVPGRTGTPQEEQFVVERTGLSLGFGQRQQTVAVSYSLNQIERALDQRPAPNSYDALIEALKG